MHPGAGFLERLTSNTVLNIEGIGFVKEVGALKFILLLKCLLCDKIMFYILKHDTDYQIK